MEKLNVTRCIDDKIHKKISKNYQKEKITKKSKNLKNIKKIAKKHAFLSKIKANLHIFLIFCIFLIVSVTSILLTFLHNEYYNFLIRPKVISSSFSILILMLLSLFANLVIFVFDFFCISKNIQKNNAENFEKRVDKYSFKNFIFYDLIFVFNCFTCLSFLLKLLSFCVLFQFANLIICIQKISKLNKKSSIHKAFFIIMFLILICVASAFYMLFMLN